VKIIKFLCVILACVSLFSCTEEPAEDTGGSPSGRRLPAWRPAGPMVPSGASADDKLEEGLAPPEDTSLSEGFRTPEACFRTGIGAVRKGDALTWRRCHEGRMAVLQIQVCVQRQRSLLKDKARDMSEDEVLAMVFREITGKDGKGMASAAVGKTRWSKDGKSARISVTYGVPDGEVEYRFVKTPDGWKFERPCLMPPPRQ